MVKKVSFWKKAERLYEKGRSLKKSFDEKRLEDTNRALKLARQRALLEKERANIRKHRSSGNDMLGNLIGDLSGSPKKKKKKQDLWF